MKAVDEANAERIAKSLRTTASHMVCIVIDWRREKRWRPVDVSAFQTVGPIREVVAGAKLRQGKSHGSSVE